MIFNPRDGGRLVLHVDEGSLVIDVRSARVAYQSSSMEARSQSKTVIRLDCELEGALVHTDTKEDRTEAIILHGEKDSPEAVVLVAKDLTAVNVSINFPGITEITIEAYGLPIQYSKLVEMALQEKGANKVPDSRILMPQSVLELMQKKWINDQSSPMASLAGVIGSPAPSPIYTGSAGIHHTQSVKVWPRVLTDEEILNDQED